MRMFVLVAIATAVLPARAPSAPAVSRASPPGTAAIRVRFALPVPSPPVVLAPFRAPADPYAAGHRGVDLATARAGPVRAAADGVVQFAGDVAGRGVVVVAHADGITTEYEPLRPVVHAGDRVLLGTVLGTVSGVHGSCPPDACVHWAARREAAYLDPMTLLAPLGAVRLLPWSP